MRHQMFQSCIDACNQCAVECKHCASECLHDDNIQTMVRCIGLNRDCALICFTASSYMASGSEFAASLCQLCADICHACADECRQHHTDHCQRCAEACEQCADECQKLVAQTAPASKTRQATPRPTAHTRTTRIARVARLGDTPTLGTDRSVRQRPASRQTSKTTKAL